MNNITGRTKEKNYLFRSFDQAKDGRGQIILVSGEAGVGKTALVEETLSYSGLKFYTARCSSGSAPPYGPIISILRNCISESKVKTIDCDGLTKYLPIVLPELGEQTAEANAETLKEAIISALFSLAKKPTAIFIDDIQWADDATIDLLTAISDRIGTNNIIIVCTYISDEITRDHNVKKFKNELRRRRKLNELNVEPLNKDETSQFISSILNGVPDIHLVEKIFSSTQGIPLFIEELVNSLVDNYQLKVGSEKISLAEDADIKIPVNLRDAVLIKLNNITPEARNKLEAASVAGFEFNPALIAMLTGDEKGFDELVKKNLIVEIKSDLFSFRHTIFREVIKEQVIWSKRKALHRKIAEYLEDNKAHSDIVAAHWASANENERAIKMYIASVDHACSVHAYDDAIHAANRALELWKENNEEDKKYDLLLKYAHCCYMTSKLNESVRALKEITESRVRVDTKRLAEAYRMLATIYTLMRMGEMSASSRLKSAELFDQSGLKAEAAIEFLLLAGKYTAQLNLTGALQCTRQASEKAHAVGRMDIDTEARGLAGYVLAMQGKFPEGRNTAQEALADALKYNLTDTASIIYKRLAGTLEYASDYSSARDAYFSAYNYCITEGQDVNAQICLGCMSYTLFQTGEWKKSLEICDQTIKNKNTPEQSVSVAHATKGVILAFRGEIKSAQKNLNRSIEIALKHDAVANQMFALWGLAVLSEYSSDLTKSVHCYLDVINLWKKTQEKHDIILFLIWAGYFFSDTSLRSELTLCTQLLDNIASSTGNPEALTGLAFILGENAVFDGNYLSAIEQYYGALDHLEKLNMPFLQMLIHYRIGIAYSKTEDKINAKKFFLSSNSISKNLGIRPFSVKIGNQLDLLGIKPEESRNPDSEERAARSGLTRRQSEILQLISEGLTNKEIADKLFLSTRTVDMHVGHILERLNCKSRTEAISRAQSLKLV